LPVGTGAPSDWRRRPARRKARDAPDRARYRQTGDAAAGSRGQDRSGWFTSWVADANVVEDISWCQPRTLALIGLFLQAIKFGLDPRRHLEGDPERLDQRSAHLDCLVGESGEHPASGRVVAARTQINVRFAYLALAIASRWSGMKRYQPASISVGEDREEFKVAGIAVSLSELLPALHRPSQPVAGVLTRIVIEDCAGAKLRFKSSPGRPTGLGDIPARDQGHCASASVIVTSAKPEKDLQEERWPWVLDVKVPLVVPRLDLAPRLSEMDVATTSVRQQSHIRLTEDQFESAVDALAGLVD
jgi:hypothetical protein